jgi:hypothetical protein
MYPAHIIRPLARILAGLTAGQNRPAAPATISRRRTIAAPRLLPHTIQLCIHCRHNPAGLWVRHTSGQTVRRPWCLSCCQDLDPGCHHLEPFDSQNNATAGPPRRSHAGPDLLPAGITRHHRDHRPPHP